MLDSLNSMAIMPFLGSIYVFSLATNGESSLAIKDKVFWNYYNNELCLLED